MGLPLLSFYDTFLSRSVTLTETTSSCLWCVTGASPRHVYRLVLSTAPTRLGGRAGEEEDVLLSFFCVNCDCCGEPHRDTMALFSRANTKTVYFLKQNMQIPLVREKCEFMEFRFLSSLSLSFHFQLKTCPEQYGLVLL